MQELFIQIGTVVFVYMTLFYIASLILKDASIVDIAWGIGFIVIAATCILLRGSHSVLVLISVLVGIWGIRLSGHILQRKLRSPGEDFRYAAWRKNWGSTFLWRSYLQVFLLQGCVMMIIALPVLATAEAGFGEINFISILGTAVWIFGFLFEAIGDKQLEDFKANTANKGKIITSGLWKYTRHPNYFGESVQWWGIWVIALSVAKIWWIILSPALLTYLLLYVSGVPMLEKKYDNNAEYQAYKRKTSKFVPWFPM